MSKIDNEQCHEVAVSIEDLLTEYTRFRGERVKYSDTENRTIVIQDRHNNKKFKITVEPLEDEDKLSPEELKEFYNRYGYPEDK